MVNTLDALIVMAFVLVDDLSNAALTVLVNADVTTLVILLIIVYFVSTRKALGSLGLPNLGSLGSLGLPSLNVDLASLPSKITSSLDPSGSAGQSSSLHA